MKISSLNQIAHASQFVDVEVESAVRTFHQQCLSVAGTNLDPILTQPYLSFDDLRRAELAETRFSHISSELDGSPSDRPSGTMRWPSLTKGRTSMPDFQTIAQIFHQAIGADQDRRRPYPSGGGLYSVEAVIITSEGVAGVADFSVLHYLPVSNAFEVLPGRYDRDSFRSIYNIESVSFYVAYFVSLKKAIFKYRSRGYRLALLEIGSMYQQLLWVAQSYGLASRVLSGFSEYALAKNCGLDSRLLLPGIIQAFACPEHL